MWRKGDSEGMMEFKIYLKRRAFHVHEQDLEIERKFECIREPEYKHAKIGIKV